MSLKNYHQVHIDAEVIALDQLDGKEFGGLEGKLATVTGASNGIGTATARVLAKHGAHVIMPVRNKEMGQAVVDSINAECKRGGSQGSAELRDMDLTSLASVRDFANEIIPVIQAKGGLDLLILNAGVMAVRHREETVDGFELQMGINHIGRAYLSLLLAPLIKPDGRLVSVSSIGHRITGILFDDPFFTKGNYHPWVSYGQTKTANVLFAIQMDQILAAKRGAHAFSLHPGSILTGLQKHITREEEVALGFFEPDGVTPKLDYKTIGEGASTTIYAALHKPLDAYGGAYLDDCSIAETIPPERANKEDAAKLWEMTIGWIKSKGFGGWDEEFFML